MTIPNHLAVALVAAWSLSATSVSFACSQSAAGGDLTTNGTTLAFQGFDVVAFFADGKPTIGQARYAMVFNDATYRFVNKQHLAAFEDDPAKYVSKDVSFCVFDLAVGAKPDGEPPDF